MSIRTAPRTIVILTGMAVRRGVLLCTVVAAWLVLKTYRGLNRVGLRPLARAMVRCGKGREAEVERAIDQVVSYCQSCGRYTAAGRWLERRMELGGRDPRVVARLAANCEMCGQIERAVELWREAIRVDDPDIYSLYCQAELKHPASTNASLLEAHLRFAERFVRGPAEVDYAFAPWDGKRALRVGFTCSFWTAPTISNQLLCWVRELDRSAFETSFYVNEPWVPDHLAKFADRIRHTPAGQVGHDEFRGLVRSDGIDVLVELNGFSPGHRFIAMSRRCAPVQVSYLNHTATCGVPNVDFLIADSWCIGEEDRFYTETVYRLPRSFFCFNFAAEEMPVSHTPPCVQGGQVTFGFFGSPSKFNPVFIKLLAEVLLAVPGSRLLMANAGLSCPEVRAWLIGQLAALGVEAGRLRLYPNQDRRRVAELHKEVDISLDSWPYCGGNTLAESLWYNVPAITLRGNRFSENYGSSLLTACGLEDLVAHSQKQYVDIASKLAADQGRLIHLRSNLRKDMCRPGGFSDTGGFADAMSDAFREMRRRADRRAPGKGAAVRPGSPSA